MFKNFIRRFENEVVIHPSLSVAVGFVVGAIIGAMVF